MMRPTGSPSARLLSPSRLAPFIPGFWLTRFVINGIRTSPPGLSPRTFPLPDSFPSHFTWCRIPPSTTVHDIKRSTVNVYKIDRDRSVRVRSTAWCLFSHFRFNRQGQCPRWGGILSGGLNGAICPRGMSYTLMNIPSHA